MYHFKRGFRGLANQLALLGYFLSVTAVILNPDSKLLAEEQMSWKQYPFHVQGTDIYFPKDEGWHKMLPNLEWWYVVMHVRGEVTGHEYSILVTHFNNMFRFFTVTNLTTQVHTSGTTMGALKANDEYLDLVQTTMFGQDYFRSKKDTQGELIPFEYEIETNHSQMHLKADLVSQKAPMMAAGLGYVAVGSVGHSWYYSLTRLNIKGVLAHDGRSEPISGIAWMDHQWGPFVVSPVEAGRLFETYEWYCIQLDNGLDLMISNIYDRQYRLNIDDPRYGGVSVYDSNGEMYNTLDRSFTRTAYWKDPRSQKYMSMGWELDVPGYDLHLKMEPKMLDQMVRFPLNGDFWEGSIKVSGTVAGQAVTGKSFGELIHQFEVPKVTINSYKKQAKLGDSFDISWAIANPDQGNPLKFSISAFNPANNEELILAEDLVSSRTTLLLNHNFFSRLNQSGFKLRVKAYSIDKTISGQNETTVISLHE